MEGLQSGIEICKSGAQKISPALDWISTKVAGFIDVSVENVHLLLLAGISLYLASILNGRDNFGIKFWLIAGGLFWGLKYLGF